jgi:NAD(P)-dependent dehydrogenase (short-subunit alcohol dehydrogenase family)
MDMSNQSVLITGAAGGLGRAVAKRMAHAGWTVVAAGRDPERLQDLEAVDHRVAADVSTPDGAAEALAAAAAHLGQVPGALVHCAGGTLIQPLHRTGDDSYRNTLAANLDSAFFTLRAYVRALLDAKQRGSAVLVSTVAAAIGVPNHEAIAAAKGGVEALVRSAAATYSGQGVRVNAVAPGLMETPATASLLRPPGARDSIAAQYPLGRHGQPEDVAAAIAWLAGDDADWVTGQVLPVDGGFTAVRPLVRVGTARRSAA